MSGSEIKINTKISDGIKKITLRILLFSLILSVYLYSLCPTVYLIDSGELAAVSWTLGIAHPTGYPIYTLISYLFSHLPGEPIKNLNLLSTLFSISTAILIYITATRITGNESISALITAIFSFSPIIWRISITNEVYPLTVLFCTLSLFMLYSLKDSRTFYFIMFLFGLAFTNHIIIFSLVFPLFFYLTFVYKPPLKKILIGFLFTLIGISPYLYLILRTLAGAEIAWGNTCNLQRLFWHITGRQYQVWMFSLPIKEILNNAKQGLVFITTNFLYIFIIFVFPGFFYLFKKNRKKFWLLLIIFLLNFLYTINYAIPDIESYYIPGYIALLLASIYGLYIFKKYIRWFVSIPLLLLFALVNYPSCTLRDNTLGLDYSFAHISQLPENSLLISSYWDIYSPTIYLRKVKKIYKELVIIDKELLRRTWYLKYLKNEYPEFYSSAEKEINDYLSELYKFEYNKPYDPHIIQNKFIKMLERFVEIKETTGVYFALPFPDYDLNSIKPDYYRIPCGLNFWITRNIQTCPFDFSQLEIKHPAFINDPRLKFNIETVKRMINNNINYLTRTGRINEAEMAKKWLNDFSIYK